MKSTIGLINCTKSEVLIIIVMQKVDLIYVLIWKQIQRAHMDIRISPANCFEELQENDFLSRVGPFEVWRR